MMFRKEMIGQAVSMAIVGIAILVAIGFLIYAATVHKASLDAVRVLSDRVIELESRPAPPPAPPAPYYDDMAGLDAETQAIMAERERNSEQTERRLRYLERNIEAVNSRIFGRSVIFPGQGQVGDSFGADGPPLELGSEGDETQ